ncbi:MAG: hypothetical protein R3318_03565 [Gammaproteobacteria bacterium]|nr:hypothetical protein [Gammaproteobacteria bacterium]
MPSQKQPGTVAGKISLALQFLENSIGLSGTDQFDQLEREINCATELIKDILATADTGTLTREEIQGINRFLDLSRTLAASMKSRRSAIRDEFLKLNNGARLADRYRNLP